MVYAGDNYLPAWHSSFKGGNDYFQLPQQVSPHLGDLDSQGWAPSLSSAPPPVPSGLSEWTEGLLLSPHGISIASTMTGIIPMGGILQVAFTRKSEGGAPAGLVFLFVLASFLCLWLSSFTCPGRSTDPNCVSLLYDLCPESELPDLLPWPLKKLFSGCESPICFHL